ncbi:P-loop containing nucleoside triphosphate hydrolase protein [Pholiota molesta]|nr:P-loop containing nucleoside triphosphate hydrolase protein [Pholiota molesta]
MASSSSSFLKALVPRAYALSARAPLFRLSALTRSSHVVALPRRLFPCDMLLARNASTAAMQARIPTSLYANEETPEPPKDGQQPFSTVADKLHPDTLKAIKHTNMSVVQSRIFPLLPHLAEPHDPTAKDNSKRPRDLLVKAKTGTGKTMAFLAIDAHVARAHADSGLGEKWFASDTVGTLILSPTRELATQIAVEAANLTVHHKGFQVQVLLGGESKGRQIASWERGRKDIVVATPGRMMDLIDSVPMFSEALAHTKILVLDEADTLLDMGFKPDIEKISLSLPKSPQRQTFLFSATVSREIQGIARTLMSPSHTFVNCVSESDVATHTHIPQYTTVLPGAGAALSNPAAFPMPTRTYEMHAKRDMSQRVRISNAFRGDVALGSAAVLITSDVSARGVDYPGVTRVIQLGVPASPDMYVHRVGRTGRGGDRGGKGRGDLIVCQWEADAVRRIESAVGVKALPLETQDVERECLQLLKDGAASAIPPAPAPAPTRGGARAPRPTGPYGAANLESLPALCTSLTQRLAQPPKDYPDAPASDEFSGTFLAQLGFYIGRVASTGLRQDRISAGLQASYGGGGSRFGGSSAGGYGATSSYGGGRSTQDTFKRGDPQREGYRKREGGAFGYTPAAGRRTSPANEYTRDRDSSRGATRGRSFDRESAPHTDHSSQYTHHNVGRYPGSGSGGYARSSSSGGYARSSSSGGGYARSSSSGGALGSGSGTRTGRYSKGEDAY